MGEPKNEETGAGMHGRAVDSLISSATNVHSRADYPGPIEDLLPKSDGSASQDDLNTAIDKMHREHKGSVLKVKKRNVPRKPPFGSDEWHEETGDASRASTTEAGIDATNNARKVLKKLGIERARKNLKNLNRKR